MTIRASIKDPGGARGITLCTAWRGRRPRMDDQMCDMMDEATERLGVRLGEATTTEEYTCALEAHASAIRAIDTDGLSDDALKGVYCMLAATRISIRGLARGDDDTTVTRNMLDEATRRWHQAWDNMCLHVAAGTAEQVHADKIGETHTAMQDLADKYIDQQKETDAMTEEDAVEVLCAMYDDNRHQRQRAFRSLLNNQGQGDSVVRELLASK